MEEELDLRKYVRVMLKHWKLIGSICVLAVIAVVLISLLSPPAYKAEAAVLITTDTSAVGAVPGDQASTPRGLHVHPRSPPGSREVHLCGPRCGGRIGRPARTGRTEPGCRSAANKSGRGR